MANVVLLREKIDESGMTVTAVADKAGMLRQTLYNRLAERGEFLCSEVVGLSKALHLTKAEREEIFF